MAAIDWATKALVHGKNPRSAGKHADHLHVRQRRAMTAVTATVLTRHKATTWEGGQRVFHRLLKDHIKPSVNEEIICALDLLPSFAAMLGSTCRPIASDG